MRNNRVNKGWKIATVILIVLFGLFFIWILTPVYYEDFEEDYSFDKGTINGEANPNFLFFPETNISYSMNSLNYCGYERFSRIQKAFGIIERETQGLIFFNFEFEGDIIFDCPENQHLDGNTAGEGGPIFYEGYREIIGGEITLYPYGEDKLRCESYPTTEIHEILHVFGFGHFYDEDSIMHEGSDEIELYEWEDDQPYVCQEIDYEIVECLKNIYSNGVEGSSCEGLNPLNEFS